MGTQVLPVTLMSVPQGSGGPGLCPVSWRTVYRGTVRHVTGHSQGLQLTAGTVEWAVPARRTTPVPPNRGMAGRGLRPWSRVWATPGPGAASAEQGRISSGQLWPSNRLVTEPSLKTSLIARARSGAMDSTVSLSNFFS